MVQSTPHPPPYTHTHQIRSLISHRHCQPVTCVIHSPLSRLIALQSIVDFGASVWLARGLFFVRYLVVMCCRVKKLVG